MTGAEKRMRKIFEEYEKKRLKKNHPPAMGNLIKIEE